MDLTNIWPLWVIVKSSHGEAGQKEILGGTSRITISLFTHSKEDTSLHGLPTPLMCITHLPQPDLWVFPLRDLWLEHYLPGGNGYCPSVAMSWLTLCNPMDCSPPDSREFSRQEYHRGLPFPSPVGEWEKGWYRGFQIMFHEKLVSQAETMCEHVLDCWESLPPKKCCIFILTS